MLNELDMGTTIAADRKIKSKCEKMTLEHLIAAISFKCSVSPRPYIFHTYHTHTCSNCDVWCRNYSIFLLARYTCWHHPNPPVSQHHNHDQQNLQSVWHVGECWPHSLYFIHFHQHCEFHYGRLSLWCTWSNIALHLQNVTLDNYEEVLTSISGAVRGAAINEQIQTTSNLAMVAATFESSAALISENTSIPNTVSSVTWHCEFQCT